MTSREDNDAECASSVETGRAAEQREQHDPNAQDSKTMQVVQVQSLQTPPGHDPFPFSTCVCRLNYCSSANLCIFGMGQNLKTQSLYRREVGFLEAYWMQLCSHLKDTNLSSPLTLMNYSISPSRAETDRTYFPGNTELKSAISSSIAPSLSFRS